MVLNTLMKTGRLHGGAIPVVENAWVTYGSSKYEELEKGF